MKVKILSPIKGFAYFEGDVADIPNKIAEKLISEKKVEPFKEAKDDKKVEPLKEAKGDKK